MVRVRERVHKQLRASFEILKIYKGMPPHLCDTMIIRKKSGGKDIECGR